MAFSITKDIIGRVGRCVGGMEGRCSWSYTVPPCCWPIGCFLGLVWDACWELNNFIHGILYAGYIEMVKEVGYGCLGLNTLWLELRLILY